MLPAPSAIRPMELPDPPKAKLPVVGSACPPPMPGSLVNPTRYAPGFEYGEPEIDTPLIGPVRR